MRQHRKLASATEGVVLPAAGGAPQPAKSNAVPNRPLARLFEQAGVLVRLSRHQDLAVLPNPSMPSYFLRSGTLALVAQTPERHLVGFWHVNDLLETDQLAPFPALFIRALEPSELWRLPQPAAKVLLDGDSEARKDYLAQCATMLKRLAITNAMLARLSGRQRVASFLIACAVRHGYIAGNRADIPLPMSRADIADHLGLNPDTLSRLMAHMQRADLIELHGRRHLLAKDWGALCQESPIAPAILATG